MSDFSCSVASNACDAPLLLDDQEEATRATVWRIWNHVLGNKSTRAENLLHLNIGARRVIRMLEEIKLETGVALPPGAALKLGTFQAIATAIASQSWPPASPLILLKPGDDLPALFMISGGGGFILDQVDLAGRIVYPGPIYGLQLRGLDSFDDPLDRMDAIARYYLDHIYRLQPDGPYHFLGYSFGGLVAAEMARALAADGGRQIGFVGMLDSYVHDRYWSSKVWAGFMARRAVQQTCEVFALPWRQATSLAVLRATKFARRLRQYAKPCIETEPQRSVHYIGGLPSHIQRVRDSSIAAFEAFRPQRIDTAITLIKSAKGDKNYCDPELIWRPLVKRLDVVTVPGSHTTIVRPPFSSDLAKQISCRLSAFLPAIALGEAVAAKIDA